MNGKLIIASVTPDPNNIEFSLSGRLYNPDDPIDCAEFYCITGYIGMSGTALHIRYLPTYEVRWQAAALEYIRDHQSALIKAIRAKARRVKKESYHDPHTRTLARQ